MIKASYRYQVRKYLNRDCLIIEDLNLEGARSVTNDIENVVDEICDQENLKPEDLVIVYRDSEKMWDGWDHKTQDYVPLRSSTWEKALDKRFLLKL